MFWVKVVLLYFSVKLVTLASVLITGKGAKITEEEVFVELKVDKVALDEQELRLPILQ